MKLKDCIEQIQTEIIGKVYAFNDHPIADAEPRSKELYLTMIWAFALEQEDINENQILFLEALTQGLGESSDSYPEKAGKLNSEILNEFCSQPSNSSNKYVWLYDILTLFFLSDNPYENELMESLSQLLIFIKYKDFEIQLITDMANKRLIGKSDLTPFIYHFFSVENMESLSKFKDEKCSFIMNRTLNPIDIKSNTIYYNCIISEPDDLALEDNALVLEDFKFGSFYNCKFNGSYFLDFSTCYDIYFQKSCITPKLGFSESKQIIFDKCRVFNIHAEKSKSIRILNSEINTEFEKDYSTMYFSSIEVLTIQNNLIHQVYKEDYNNQFININEGIISGNFIKDNFLYRYKSYGSGLYADSKEEAKKIIIKNNKFQNCHSFKYSPSYQFSLDSSNTIKNCECSWNSPDMEPVLETTWEPALGAGLISEDLIEKE